MSTIQTRIVSLRRLPSSSNGNPQFEVTTDNGVFKTGVDASCAYGIENSEYRNVSVILTLNGSNHIVGVALPQRTTERKS